MKTEEIFGVSHLSMQVEQLIDYSNYRVSLIDLKHNEILDCIEISKSDIVRSQKKPALFINQKIASYKQDLIKVFGI